MTRRRTWLTSAWNEWVTGSGILALRITLRSGESRWGRTHHVEAHGALRAAVAVANPHLVADLDVDGVHQEPQRVLPGALRRRPLGAQRDLDARRDVDLAVHEDRVDPPAR